MNFPRYKAVFQAVADTLAASKLDLRHFHKPLEAKQKTAIGARNNSGDEDVAWSEGYVRPAQKRCPQPSAIKALER